jgi:hypothetical protein
MTSRTDGFVTIQYPPTAPEVNLAFLLDNKALTRRLTDLLAGGKHVDIEIRSTKDGVTIALRPRAALVAIVVRGAR